MPDYSQLWNSLPKETKQNVNDITKAATVDPYKSNLDGLIERDRQKQDIDTYQADNENISNTYYELKHRVNDLNQKQSEFYDKYNVSELDFILPQYGVADFINERALWQKGIHNVNGEPGWFYFKIFFNFKDTKGLFGGIMNDIIPTTSALRYLYGIRNYYKSSKIEDRMLALARFTHTLSYINSVSPWFFMGINNANKLNELNFNELTKEKSIDILCNGDAIDMRLNTLLDMYKYACYDEINQKEIIPENLRKFDMSIIIMNAPIKYFQTAMMVSANSSKIGQFGHNGSTLLNKAISGINKISGLLGGSSVTTFDYKTVNGKGNNIGNMLSFQMYSLKNCEIDPISFEGYLPSGLSNAQFFKHGNGAIKIKYDRCFKHTFNEWAQMFYGSTGIHYDKEVKQLTGNKANLISLGISNPNKYLNNDSSNLNEERIGAIQNSIYNIFFDKDTEAYKGLIDFSEAVIQDSLINVNDPEYMGNIAENYDENNYEDLWNKTKEKVGKFFSF